MKMFNLLFRGLTEGSVEMGLHGQYQTDQDGYSNQRRRVFLN